MGAEGQEYYYYRSTKCADRKTEAQVQSRQETVNFGTSSFDSQYANTASGCSGAGIGTSTSTSTKADLKAQGGQTFRRRTVAMSRIFR